MLENLGWLGAFMLAICAIPLSFQTIKNGKSDISLAFLLLWFFGEVFTLIYALQFESNQLNFNYLANILFILPILYYKRRPRQ